MLGALVGGWGCLRGRPRFLGDGGGASSAVGGNVLFFSGLFDPPSHLEVGGGFCEAAHVCVAVPVVGRQVGA